MSDNHPERPPFRQHKYYYPALKIAVIAAAVYFTFRLFGVF